MEVYIAKYILYCYLSFEIHWKICTVPRHESMYMTMLIYLQAQITPGEYDAQLAPAMPPKVEKNQKKAFPIHSSDYDAGYSVGESSLSFSIFIVLVCADPERRSP
jgi:hypothetical protein